MLNWSASPIRNYSILNFNYEIDILYIIRISCGGDGMLVHVVQEFAQVSDRA